jgi:two-component system LytT family response regulator
MSQGLRVVIADDEPIGRERIRRLLRRDPEVRVVGECADGRETLTAIQVERPDLLFLDVQMPELDGFAVLAEAPRAWLPAVVFVTAYERYALQAFDSEAVDYLLKPFTERRFYAALERARAAVARGEGTSVDRLDALLARLAGRYWHRVLVRDNDRTLVVPVGEIDWIEAAGNYVRLHAGTRAHLLRETMQGLEAHLDPARFARVHRGAIVNLARVREIEPWYSGDGLLLLTTGAKLRLSRTHRDVLERRLQAQR